jgi:hypothetical protein
MTRNSSRKRLLLFMEGMFSSNDIGVKSKIHNCVTFEICYCLATFITFHQFTVLFHIEYGHLSCAAQR